MTLKIIKNYSAKESKNTYKLQSKIYTNRTCQLTLQLPNNNIAIVQDLQCKSPGNYSPLTQELTLKTTRDLNLPKLVSLHGEVPRNYSVTAQKIQWKSPRIYSVN